MNLTMLSCSIKDRIATVTIDRPEKLNVLNASVRADLLSLMNSLRHNPDVDVVILTGSGEKAFVAGTDIEELTTLDRQSGEEYSSAGQALFDLIENLGKPVIAAVNGYALGGGCELAIACHIRIVSDRATFGLPEAGLGAIPGYGGTQRLTKIVGRGRAMEMVLTGTPIDAGEALRIGLANMVVPAADLMTAADRLARTIASKGREAIRLALFAVNAAQELPLEEGQKMEAKFFGSCCSTEDFKERTRAFLEKRKPKWKDR
jgi:enoyl-CoA hydratase